MITEEQWKEIKQRSLDKWSRGMSCETPDEFYDWWCYEGEHHCSFCRAFKDPGAAQPSCCGLCPLHEPRTACCLYFDYIVDITDEYEDSNEDELTQAKFSECLGHAKLLHTRINSINYEDLKDDSKEIADKYFKEE